MKIKKLKIDELEFSRTELVKTEARLKNRDRIIAIYLPD